MTPRVVPGPSPPADFTRSIRDLARSGPQEPAVHLGLRVRSMADISETMGAVGLKPTAVVIDDSPASRRMLRDLLEQAGLQVVAEGERGDQAIALYERHRPSVLTLDLVMPILDGATSAATVLARHPDAVIIMCSSFRSRDRILALRDLGVRHFILKPLVPAAVIEIVRRIVEETRGAPTEVSPP